MAKVKRVRLDVLKPHYPDILEFAAGLAQGGPDYEIKIQVLEMDEKTETVEIVVEGDDVKFAQLTETIKALGGSLHSIDEVEVNSAAPEVGN